MKKIMVCSLIGLSLFTVSCGTSEAFEKPKDEVKKVEEVRAEKEENSIDKAYKVLLERDEFLVNLRKNTGEKTIKINGWEYVELKGTYASYDAIVKEGLKFYDNSESFTKAFQDIIVEKDGKTYLNDSELRFIHTYFGPINGSNDNTGSFILEAAGEAGALNVYDEDKRLYIPIKARFNNEKDMKLTFIADKKDIEFLEEKDLSTDLNELINKRLSMDNIELKVLLDRYEKIYRRYEVGSKEIDKLFSFLKTPIEDIKPLSHLNGTYYAKNKDGLEEDIKITVLDKDTINFEYSIFDSIYPDSPASIKKMKRGYLKKTGENIWTGTLINKKANREYTSEVKIEGDSLYYRDTYFKDEKTSTSTEISEKYRLYKKIK